MSVPKTTLVVPNANTFTTLPEPWIKRMNPYQLREIDGGHQVGIGYPSNDPPGYTSVYVNVPIKVLRAAMPALDLIIKQKAISNTTIRAVVLPTTDYQAIRDIFGHLKDTVTTAWRKPTPIVEFAPLSVYARNAEAACAMGMTDIREDYQKKISRLLKPDLYKTRLQIPKEELETVCVHHDKSSALRIAVVSAIARANMAERLGNADDVWTVRRQYRDFDQEIVAAMGPWALKMNLGEDIRVAGV
ncbi:hypothetical protein LTS08_005479 [Lithohypha guttulata]|uniref:Uncharacterized protein n=1 Tax=Lithohypha guttulata TaxID=1690604 RepID=A0AAN7T2E7_9EURO|nr:hypothetical protein LTR05_004339 [Lithohypha guttulata]KAK5099764.1 hypothetical protein LTS08_005479 [Lithohypha guttulata]